MLDEALAIAPEHRSTWLAAQEHERPDLAPHLRRLLAALERPLGLDPLQARPARLMAEALADRRPESTVTAGDMLGPYRLLKPLGEGGMASVWLAEQTLAVLRRVALKVPHAGLEDAAATAARFVHVRDFLARPRASEHRTPLRRWRQRRRRALPGDGVDRRHADHALCRPAKSHDHANA